MKLIEGKVYRHGNWILRATKNRKNVSCIYFSTYYDKCVDFSDEDRSNYEPATPQQVRHFEACEEAQQFVPCTEIIVETYNVF